MEQSKQATSTNDPRLRGYLYVALAACLWGTLGVLFRVLHDHYGFPAITLAFLRAGIAALLLGVPMLVLRPQKLLVSKRQLAFLGLYGMAGVAAFYFFYTQAVIETNVTTAVVLLYTAPVFVTLIAWRAWNEHISLRKLSALALAFVGCALVARSYDVSQLRLNGIGLALGLGAGFTYALYTVLSKFALRQHSNSTALTYALVFGALFLLPLQSPNHLAPLSQSASAWFLLLLLAVGPTLGSLALYNRGLREVPASSASLVAMLEPVVASIIAFSVLGERMEVLQLAGGAMVIAGALLVR